MMLYKLVNWMSNNKVFILCGISFCFFVSTVALAKNGSKCTSDLLRNTINFSQQDYYRLPRSIVSKNYKLKLWPDLKTKTFNGSVAIKLEVKEAARRIQLHTNKLDLHSVLFRDSSLQSIPIKSTNTTSDRRELLVVELFEEVPKGTYKIHVSFSGKLDNGIVGFYASSFKNGK